MSALKRTIDFIPLPSKLFEAFIENKINQEELKVIFTIALLTYGLNTETEYATENKIFKYSSLKKSELKERLLTLQKKKIIEKRIEKEGVVHFQFSFI